MKYLITLCVIFCIAFLLHANGSSGGYTGNWANGQFVPLESKQISIEDEKLSIKCFRGYAEVYVRYTMKNSGDACTVNMGFPSLRRLYPEDLGFPPYKSEVSKYKISSVEKKLFSFLYKNANKEKKEALNYTFVEDNKKFTYKELGTYNLLDWNNSNNGIKELYEKKGVSIDWYVTPLAFKKGEIRTITISYTSRYWYELYGWMNSNSHYSESSFAYLLSFGSTWKGPIKNGVISIDTSVLQNKVDITPANRFKKNSDGVYTWKFTSLEPKPGDNIALTIHNGFGKYGSYNPDLKKQILYTMLILMKRRPILYIQKYQT
ncbi:MAG: hypothetical protein JXR90_11550 [Spirochaetes bacterium]|nr:hypothetical protein [Spirochaetota bacterium]